MVGIVPGHKRRTFPTRPTWLAQPAARTPGITALCVAARVPAPSDAFACARRHGPTRCPGRQRQPTQKKSARASQMPGDDASNPHDTPVPHRLCDQRYRVTEHEVNVVRAVRD